MEGEINNFIMVWTIAAATMSYCHTIGNLISHGTPRLIALIPAIILLFLLPLRLTSIHLGGPTSFFLGWLSTFKLFLFAFNKGPLSSNPPLSLPHFISLATLPIKFQHQTHNNNLIKDHKSNSKQTLRYTYAIIIIILALLIPLYSKKENFHPKFVYLLYAIHMYIGLEFFFALASTFTTKLLSVELEPQFDKPYLSTSLQEFWGKRWNITVNRVLHPTVYEPVKTFCSRWIGRKWAPLPAILATFTMSAIMHEVVFYYIKREKRTWETWEPSWDATCFFILHGVCLAVQVAVRKAFGEKVRLPTVVSWLLTVVFVMYTTLWLFVPALVRCRVYEKASRELNALNEFLNDVYDAVRFGFLSQPFIHYIFVSLHVFIFPLMANQPMD
ncbi:long-chain-alcohol O-fatty-acyltransferase-like [Vicia villosa]|uniref:long-chain-alcohol O-fatty-acyltransferase-like n=1 Tax=Vicia villosa TaxID=3911 RepID=UPI00273ACE7B|nr:long-chain-alcohol O-fatty-acyltransferase-like [Vicia villosa]